MTFSQSDITKVCINRIHADSIIQELIKKDMLLEMDKLKDEEIYELNGVSVLYKNVIAEQDSLIQLQNQEIRNNELIRKDYESLVLEYNKEIKVHKKRFKTSIMAILVILFIGLIK